MSDATREARDFNAVVADAILNLLDLRQQASAMKPENIVLFADHMADLMQELRAAHDKVAAAIAEVRGVVEGERSGYVCQCGGIGCHEAEGRDLCDRILARLDALALDTPRSPV